MYRQLQTDYENIFAKLARNAVLMTASDYEAKAYWENRTDVGVEMLNSMKTELNKVNTDVTGFMMLRIDLPDSYENAIVQTQVKTQQQTTYLTIREVNQTQ